MQMQIILVGLIAFAAHYTECRSHHIKTVYVANMLDEPLTDVKVKFGIGTKSNSVWSHVFDWRVANIETGANIEERFEVAIGVVGTRETVPKVAEIPFDPNRRGYWQVYFKIGETKYKINKDNAQLNPYAADDGKDMWIFIKPSIMFKLRIKVIIMLKSGKDFFYTTPYTR